MLPLEIIDRIAFFLPIEDCCKISDYVTYKRIEKADKHEVWNNAALLGDLGLLKWLHKNKIKEYSIRTLECAIKGQHLIVCKWLYEEVGIEPITLCYDSARNIETLEWLKECRVEPDFKTMNNAVEDGNLITVKWLYENNCERTEDVMTDAAYLGHLEIVEFIHKRDNWDINDYQSALEYATDAGHVNVVKYLVNNIDNLNLFSALRYCDRGFLEEHDDIYFFLRKKINDRKSNKVSMSNK